MDLKKSSTRGTANLPSHAGMAKVDGLKAPGSSAVTTHKEQPPGTEFILDFDPVLHQSNLELLEVLEEESRVLSDSGDDSADFSPSELCRDDPKLVEEIKKVKRAVAQIPAEVRYPLNRNQPVEEARGKHPEATNPTGVKKSIPEDPAEGLKIMAKGYAKAWAVDSKKAVGGPSAKLKKIVPAVLTEDGANASESAAIAPEVSVSEAKNNRESLAEQRPKSNLTQMEEILPDCVELWGETRTDPGPILPGAEKDLGAGRTEQSEPRQKNIQNRPIRKAPSAVVEKVSAGLGPSQGATTKSAEFWRANKFTQNRKSAPDQLLSFKAEFKGQDAILKLEHLKNLDSMWGFCLVGYIQGANLPPSNILYWLNKLGWAADYKRHESGWHVFRFHKEEDMLETLNGGPYIIQGRPIHLRRMTQSFNFSDDELSKAPVWVRLPRLPLSFWTAEALSIILSVIGEPLMMDKCTAQLERISYARAQVMIDISAETQKHINIVDPEGRKISQEVVLEYNPLFCSHCRRLGHLVGHCRQLGNEGRVGHVGQGGGSRHQRLSPARPAPIAVEAPGLVRGTAPGGRSGIAPMEHSSRTPGNALSEGLGSQGQRKDLPRQRVFISEQLGGSMVTQLTQKQPDREQPKGPGRSAACEERPGEDLRRTGDSEAYEADAERGLADPSSSEDECARREQCTRSRMKKKTQHEVRPEPKGAEAKQMEAEAANTKDATTTGGDGQGSEAGWRIPKRRGRPPKTVQTSMQSPRKKEEQNQKMRRSMRGAGSQLSAHLPGGQLEVRPQDGGKVSLEPG